MTCPAPHNRGYLRRMLPKLPACVPVITWPPPLMLVNCWPAVASTLDRIANVVHCIAAHRFRDQSITPTTLEARCLYDADKLDSIGAIGIARAFAFAGAHGSRLWREPWPGAPDDDAKPTGPNYTPVHEFVYKLSRIAGTLHTPTAQAIAAERHRFMCTYFDRLDAEMLGLA